MHDQDKSAEQLIAENEELRRRLATLQAAELERKSSLDTLRESEGRYRALSESTNDIIYILDRQGSLLYANQAASRAIGIPADQLVGKQQSDLFPAEVARTHVERIENVYATGIAREGDQRYQLGPHEVWLRTHLIPLCDEAGQITSVMGVCHNITDRKRAEEALQKAREELEERIEERTAELQEANERLLCDASDKKRVQEALARSHDELSAIYDGMFDGLIILDVESRRIVKANPSICRMLGYSEDELCSMSLSDIHPPSELPGTLQRIQGRVEGTFTGRATVQVLRKNGEVLVVDITSNVLEYRGRACIAGFFRDMTDQRRAEAALRTSEERFRVAFEEAPVGIIMVIAEGLITRVNRTFCQLSGYREDELIGSSVFDLTHPEDRKQSEELSRQVLAGEIPSFSIEKRYLRKAGGYFWAQISTSAIHDRDGRVAFALGIIENITERKEAHEALERERRTLAHMLQASDHERQLIAYDIHDGMAQELAGAIMQFQIYDHRRKTKSEEAAKSFDSAVKMLEASYGECRRLISGVRPPILDESGVVAAIAHLVYEPSFDRGPKIELRNRVRFKRLAPIMENVIYRIVQEGMANARNHSKSDKVLVALMQRGDRLRITIRDWGVGFNPASSHDNRFGIEGIRQRARLLGGTCDIKSRPGKGTRIVVELPVVEKEED
jgi:PAS domain S-box-containing protein